MALLTRASSKRPSFQAVAKLSKVICEGRLKPVTISVEGVSARATTEISG